MACRTVGMVLPLFEPEPITANRSVDPNLLKQSRTPLSVRPTIPVQGLVEIDARRVPDPRAEEE